MIKSKLMKAYWLSGAVFFSAILLARCGTDQSESSVTTAAPQNAYASYTLSAAGSLPARVDAKVAAGRTKISNDEMLNRIDADLSKLDRDTQVFTRYICFTTQWNAGAKDAQLDVYRFALTKAINSLSYESKIVIPTAIDAEKTIYRIDIRDYGWRRFQWEEIARRDPYAVFTGSAKERRIRRLTQVQRLPYTRADWFMENALQGNLYNILMQVPGNVQNLEFDFGVNVDRNIQRGDVKRAGFNGSGVSQQSRMIEWHQTRFGSYWKSYDFLPENGQSRRNLFEFALDRRNFGDGFDHAGGEMIFQLPNGLQMYMLTDNVGRRLEVAPTPIVSDLTRPSSEVTNAISCFRCHHSGMLPMARGDEVRKHYEANAFAYSRREVDFVRALYPGNAVIMKQLADDNARFDAAIKQMGKNPIASTNETNEPVFQMVQQFESELTLPLVASELNMDAATFQTQLQRSRFLSRRLGALNNGGSIKRVVFEDNFQFIVRQFGLGQVFNGRGFGLTDEMKAEGLSLSEAPAMTVDVAE